MQGAGIAPHGSLRNRAGPGCELPFLELSSKRALLRELGDVIRLAVGDQAGGGRPLGSAADKRPTISTKAGASKIAHHKPKKNNACVGGARGQTIGNVDYEAWAKVLDANTLGPLRGWQRRLSTMWHEASAAYRHPYKRHGIACRQYFWRPIAYRSSKAAVNMVMRSLAIDLAPRGITCVVVNPGWVQTDMGGTHATLRQPEACRS